MIGTRVARDRRLAAVGVRLPGDALEPLDGSAFGGEGGVAKLVAKAHGEGFAGQRPRRLAPAHIRHPASLGRRAAASRRRRCRAPEGGAQARSAHGARRSIVAKQEKKAALSIGVAPSPGDSSR
jgi:hypothetical protein